MSNLGLDIQFLQKEGWYVSIWEAILYAKLQTFIYSSRNQFKIMHNTGESFDKEFNMVSRMASIH